MRLLHVKLYGYRRLSGISINLDGRLVAIVGPNEAGKSSLLDALVAVESDDAIEREDRTRGQSFGDSDTAIELRYLLDAEDKAALQHIPEAAEARYFVLQKRFDGTTGSDVRPEPRRDLGPRSACLRRLERLVSTKAVREARQVTDELDTAIDSAVAILRKADGSLSEDDRLVLDGLSNELLGDGWSTSANSVGRALNQLVEHESHRHPRAAARATIGARRPNAVIFTAADRNLRDAYRMVDLRQEVPKALGNLFALAKIDADALSEAVDTGDHAAKESLIRAGNVELDDRFSEAWRQSNVSVQLSIDGETLRVFAAGEGRSVTSVAERSDGLRSFVSLIGFLAATGVSAPPVLLIDEAEQHLHYDAQADLVRMLTRQREANQVVYTTHSAGCLPEDFGAAVRVVEPDENAERSRVRNAYWDGQSAGFDSLLFGMGATTFAFAAARRAVIAEGPSEVILLPRLLREATSSDEIGFQIAPGLAGVDRAAAAQLDLAAARVAYVIDNDGGGAAIAKLLRKAGVQEERIVAIALKRRDSNTLEDLLDVGPYARAVNEELRRSHGDSVQITAAELGGLSRLEQLRKACESRNVSPPNKTAVARRLVELESDVALLSKAGASALRTAHGALIALL